MAPLINFVLLGFVASLSNSVHAAQPGSNIKRVDLAGDCPTCKHEPPHFGPHPWGDWSITTTSTSSSSVAVSTPSSEPTYGGINTSSVPWDRSSMSEFGPSTSISQSSSTFTLSASSSPSSSSDSSSTGSISAGFTPSGNMSSSTWDLSTIQSINSVLSMSSESLVSVSTNGTSDTQAASVFPSTAGSASQDSFSVVFQSTQHESQATMSVMSASNFSQPVAQSSTSEPFPANSTSSVVPPVADNSTSTVVPPLPANDTSTMASSVPSDSASTMVPPSSADGTSSTTPPVHSDSTLTMFPPFPANGTSSIVPSMSSNSSPSGSTLAGSTMSAQGPDTNMSSSTVNSVTFALTSNVTAASEITTSFTSTIDLSSTTFVTVIRTTISIVQVSSTTQDTGSSTVPVIPESSNSGTPVSESSFSAGETNSTSVSNDSSSSTIASSAGVSESSPSSSGTVTLVPGITMTPPAVTSASALPMLSLTGDMACSYSYSANQSAPSTYNLPPWCWPWPVAESTTVMSGAIVAASTENCVCPYCWLADPLCYAQTPTGSSCADGWICSVTTSTGSSGVVHSLPSGFTSDTTTPEPWSIITERGVSRTSGSSSITDVTWSATLSQSTRSIEGGYVVFPFWSWSCIGPLCQGDCGDVLDWAAAMAGCIFGLGCKRPCSDHGSNGFPLPPVHSHSSSSPSCACGLYDLAYDQLFSSALFSKLVGYLKIVRLIELNELVQLLLVHGILFLPRHLLDLERECTSTTAPACTVSPWWNDPAISAQIASWITQFPPIPDNATTIFSTFSFSSNTTQTMGNTTSSTTTSTSHSTSLTSHSSTISSPPITTPTLPSSLRDFTVLVTDDDGDVFSEVYSGGVMVSSTLVSSRLLPTLDPSGPWTFGSSGVSLVSRTTSTSRISAGTGAHPTLTSIARSYSEVSIFTCDGEAAFGSASCTDSWGLKTVSTTVPNADEQTSYCAHWTAFTTTTSPAKAGVVNCATPVSGQATSAVATVWNSGLPFSPFQLDKGPIKKFCKKLVDRDIVLYQGLSFAATSSSEVVSPGECDLFPSNGDSAFDYDLTIGLAFDYNGCPSPTGTPLVNGVSMKKYGQDKCVSTFWNHITKECDFSNSEAKKRGLGQWTRVGGMYWADCMRWTLIAARKDLSPPDTVDGDLQ
ncbi:hypothetical protein Z517_07566 [Fonsecaea pedrosoi CBS 271.37]|uniref:Uncharacterized protein n=1 Tax=Fonsecaea pedrosoi CBS 271.37 TaxID=1442368 RepID=A0A0D2GAR4_9EURO|nr:uncharacterized protein Z517_07566 [Fonsecaea pedrosoi CBS 271.37]KIW77733.1 hypothetical protein Z517_07566 [Fonsecaea pedrosoi CBS 271.37]